MIQLLFFCDASSQNSMYLESYLDLPTSLKRTPNRLDLALQRAPDTVLHRMISYIRPLIYCVCYDVILISKSNLSVLEHCAPKNLK